MHVSFLKTTKLILTQVKNKNKNFKFRNLILLELLLMYVGSN